MVPCRVVLIGVLCFGPAAARADGLYLPWIGLSDAGERPSYRQAYDDFPPPQHNVLGMPVPPPLPEDRPSYRESYNDFPPAGGRYGGGFIEYVITGGHMAPPAEPAPPPAYAPPAYYPPARDYRASALTAAASLPRSNLPDYVQDQPPAYYGGVPAPQ